MRLESEGAIEHRIAQIKRELTQLGRVRPGHLSQQYNVCGTPGCRCKAQPPQKHGPYYQISYTWQGKSSSQFVRRENLAAVRQQLRNYQRLRALVDEWVSLGLVAVKLEDRHVSSRPKPSRKTRIRPKAGT